MFRFRIILLLILSACNQADRITSPASGIISSSIDYKVVGEKTLKLEMLRSTFSSARLSTAIIFFHGGGFTSGNRSQFLKQATYFAQRGGICFLADYSLSPSQSELDPFQALEDAKSAIRFLRKQASFLKIDEQKIVAIGGSAGGYLAIGSGLLNDYNDTEDDSSISASPNLSILFNPLLDTGPGTFASQFFGTDFQRHSPIHNISQGAPACLILSGSEDKVANPDLVMQFQQKMLDSENICEVVIYEGADHGFFNYEHKENFISTVMEVDKFLISQNFLNPKPEVSID